MYFSPKKYLPLFCTSLVLFCFSLKANAQYRTFTETISNSDDTIGSEYYTIADPEEDSPEFFTPLNAVKALNALEINLFETRNDLPTEQNLLSWVFHETPNPENPEKYQRRHHFGSWIKDPSHQTCLNVRGLILQRDALGELTYADERHCRIIASRWIDPYTNSEVNDAENLQVDHVVPLKNAYISGAWSWNASQRCNYANFMANDFHLLAVLGTENGRKSDSTPEKYIPPKASFVCRYLVDWLKIKSIWKLKLSKKEALAIEAELRNYNCTASDFQLDWNELHSQRSKSYEYPDVCGHFPEN